MSRSYLGNEIIARGRFYSDVPSTSRVTAAQAIDLLNVELSALWTMLVDGGLGFYPILSQSYTIAGGVGALTLPAAFGRLVGVERMLSGQVWELVERMQPSEVPDFNVTGAIAAGYYVDGPSLVLVPIPSNGNVYRIRYYAAPVKIVDPATESVDGVEGWEDYIAWGLAARIRVRDNTDAASCLQMQAKERDRVLGGRMKRSPRPGHIRNVDSPWLNPRWKRGRTYD